jgi:two-component system response regulator
MTSEGPDVLLVDDDSNDVVVALRAFRRHAMEDRIKVLGGGEAAVEYLLGADAERHLAPPPKLILLDLRMPRLDGRSVLRALRADARTRNIPIVVVTSSTHESDARDCYALGANDFVVKHFDPRRPGEYLVETALQWLAPAQAGG